MFKTQFDKFACVGDTIEATVDEFDVTARIEQDTQQSIDDDDTHNVDQLVTGCDDEQQAKLLVARDAYARDEWGYCGIVLSVSYRGVELDDCAASLWGIAMNYPNSDNTYLSEVANELLDETITMAKARLAELRAKLTD